MRAELKWLHSPDVEDLKQYWPKEPDNFGFLLQAMMGPAGQEGEESFNMVVCTPKWLKQTHADADIVLGRHHLIVFRYDYQSLLNYIRTFAERCTGESWQEIAQKLSRLGRWEFEDHQK